jgi:phosphatidate cytidylyltransferase
MSTTAVRFVSGVALGLPVIGLIVWGGIPYSLLIGLLMLIALLEYRGLFKRVGVPVFAVPAVGASWLLGAVVLYKPLQPLVEPLLAGLLLVLTLLTLFAYRSGTKTAFSGMMVTVGAIFYIGWAGKHMISLRTLDEGMYWTLTVLITTSLADVAAYFSGRAFGRTPLAPQISPKKTWEGLAGALVVSTLSGVLLVVLWGRLGSSIAPIHGAAIGFLMAAITPLGDLLVSTLKRYVDAKDTGKLIPGHGGILDRVDTHLVAGVIGFYYITFFVR